MKNRIRQRTGSRWTRPSEWALSPVLQLTQRQWNSVGPVQTRVLYILILNDILILYRFTRMCNSVAILKPSDDYLTGETWNKNCVLRLYLNHSIRRMKKIEYLNNFKKIYWIHSQDTRWMMQFLRRIKWKSFENRCIPSFIFIEHLPSSSDYAFTYPV
jgi:hypothetical protein